MRRENFEALVAEALGELPPEFRSRLENIDVVVEDWPRLSHLGRAGLRRRMDLLGLYQGVPLTKRGTHYGMVAPDKITLFRKPIEARCRSHQEVKREIGRVVRHEIAHHFGLSERRLELIEKERTARE